MIKLIGKFHHAIISEEHARSLIAEYGLDAMAPQSIQVLRLRNDFQILAMDGEDLEKLVADAHDGREVAS